MPCLRSRRAIPALRSLCRSRWYRPPHDRETATSLASQLGRQFVHRAFEGEHADRLTRTEDGARLLTERLPEIADTDRISLTAGITVLTGRNNVGNTTLSPGVPTFERCDIARGSACVLLAYMTWALPGVCYDGTDRVRLVRSWPSSVRRCGR